MSAGTFSPVQSSRCTTSTPDQLSTPGARKVLLVTWGPFNFRRLNALVRMLTFILLVGNQAPTFCLTVSQPTQTASDACGSSDQIYASDTILMRRHEAPTHFRLMTSRYVAMVEAVRGYHCSGTVTVGFDGHHYFETGWSDDPGMIELIPTAARFMGRSLANTYDILIFAAISSGLLIGYAGFWKLYPDRQLRGIGAAVFLCLGIAEAVVADEYVFQISPLIAGIPWLLHFGLKRKPFALTASAALLAFCCSWYSLMRTGTLVICMTFLLTMFVARYRIQNPFLPILLIVLACVPSVLFERSLIARRDTALAKFGATATSVNGRALWHTAYIGLGFIPNSEVSEYRDGVAEEKVRSIDPTVAYTSTKYEAILRREMWSIVKRRPMLVIRVLAVKMGIVILLALILLYPARRLMFAGRAVFWLDAALVLAMGVSAMNAIVAVPRPRYLLTFLCLAFLYSSIKLCGERFLPTWDKTPVVPYDGRHV
jgi:hypothetical protein